MRPQKIDDQALLNNLMNVITAKGYEGASLNELADASGLKKASLYHRFPGGKKDIAIAVLNFIREWIDKTIIKVLGNSELPPEVKLEKGLKNIEELYRGGKSTCILRALSMENGFSLFKSELAIAADDWLLSFEKLGTDFGMKRSDAKRTSIEVLTKIQGSLVVSKLMNDDEVFKKALEDIKMLYKKA